MGIESSHRRAVLRGAAGLVATVLAGCQDGNRGTTTSKTATRSSTARPEPLTLGPTDSGRTLTVERGTEVLVEVRSNPSTGYEWQYASDGTVVNILEDEFVRTETAEPGAPGTRRIRLEVVGSGRFVMEYVRPWETPTEPEDRFVVTFALAGSAGT